MHITTKLRRTVAMILLSAGLAYPACAAVCPKGIGGCTSPGRCSLFVDADGSSLCDYTGRSGSSTTGTGSAQSTLPSAPQNSITSATPASSTPLSTASDTSVSAGHGTTGTGIFDLLTSSAVLIGILVFAILASIMYYAFRRGIAGARAQRAGPAGALSVFFALGISLMVTHTLAPDTSSGMACALIYTGAGTLLSAYLWHAGAMSRTIILAMAALSTAAGFAFLAPLMPLEFAGIVSTLSGASGLTVAVCIICVLILITMIFGRTFCAHVCPVGSVQELAHAVSAKKIDYGRSGRPEFVRLAIFVIAIVAALFFVDLMEYTGLYQLFSLTLTTGFWVGLSLIVISIIFYRPICRIICPFGVLFSLMGVVSRFRLRRTASCIDCRKCEKVCPVHAAGEQDSKRECYLCGRCTEVCPVSGALRYTR